MSRLTPRTVLTVLRRPFADRVQRRRVIARCLALGAVVAFAGCGPAGFTFHPVSGKLTIDGKVPSNVQVSLYPVSGKGPIASGTVDASSGQFQLTSSGGVNKPSGKGAVAGKYKVVLNSSSGAAGGMSPEDAMKQYQGIGQGKSPAAPKASFPKEFGSASTSPKEVEVKAGPNTIDLAL